jgi:hypothetical protein
MADFYTRYNNQLLLGTNPATSYQLWPAPTGVPATGIAVVCGAGAWGNVADIVAAGAIAVQFWCVGLFIQTLAGGAIQTMEFLVSSTGPAAGAGGPVTAPFIFSFRIDPSLITLDYGYFPLPYPVYRAAGARVCYCAGGAAARSVAVSLLYAINL